MLNDIQYGLRQLTKSPAFTLIAVIALALGIAGSTAIFSVIDGVLLHALPYPESDHIVSLAQTVRSTAASRGAAAPANYVDWQAQSDVFESMAAGSGSQADLTDGDRPERVRMSTVTASLFPLFRVPPLLGRTLQPSDEKPGRDHVVVISSELWARRYGSEKSVLGRELMVNGEPHTIVGVMPAGFSPDGYGELWIPSPFGVPPNSLRVHEDPRPVRDSTYLDVWGRLKSGVTLEQARVEMDAIGQRLENQYPADNEDTGIRVLPIYEEAVGEIRPVLWVLFAAVGALLFIGCANVANLLLARAATRTREVSIRFALGASRARVIRQLLTESLLLALLGGALGVLLAAWAIPALLAIGPPGISSFKNIGLNGEVLAFTLATSVATGILFGLAPAISASSAAPADGLKQGERGGSAAASRGRAILIMIEVALSLVLLIGTGLMVKSFASLTRVHSGFTSDHLLIFNIGAPARWSEDEQIHFYHQTLERLRVVPGVLRVGAVSRLPLAGGNSARSFHVLGSSADYNADIRVGTPDYFKTMDIPLLRGRNFAEYDVKGAAPVAIVNDAFARAVFPGEDPLGKFITDFGPRNEKLQIVGVVGNVHHSSLATAPRPELYQPLGQAMWPGVFVTLRTAPANPLSLLPAVQEAVWSVNKSVPLGNPRTMKDLIARSLMQRRFTIVLLGIFAGTALLLAAIGLYGVISYSVAQRTRELGIRMALGAQRTDVLKLVVREGMTLVALGVAMGLAASIGLTRLISSLLFGVSATDPLTFAALAFALGAIALLACLLPARRASLIDPMIALRAE